MVDGSGTRLKKKKSSSVTMSDHYASLGLSTKGNEMKCGDCGAHNVLLVDGVICSWCSYIREVGDCNYASHHIGVVDDCHRCIDCEIGVWNAHLEPCFA